jgi:hypothetical protein
MKKHLIFALGGAALVLGSGVHAAAPVVSGYAQIKTLDSYSGDTVVFLETNPVGCDQGFWMRPDQPGFKANLDAITKAAHAKARVKIEGNAAEMWPQMDVDRCRLQSVEVEPIAHVSPVTEGNTSDPTVIDKSGAGHIKQERVPSKMEPPAKVLGDDTPKPLEAEENTLPPSLQN